MHAEGIRPDYSNVGANTHEKMTRFADRESYKPEDMAATEEQYSKLFEKYEPKFIEALEELLALWNSPEHRGTLGHDNIHISYDLLEFLNHVHDNPGMSQSEKYIDLFGSLLHDLGRYPELLISERSGAMDVDEGSQIQLHAALSGYIGAVFARKFKAEEEDDSDIVSASKSFNKRVISAALFHGGRNEERDTAALQVQTTDRLAGVLGSREFVRNIVTDGVQRGASVYPDERFDFSDTMPGFNNLPIEDFQSPENAKSSRTNILHYIEMPMRNLFPLSDERAEERADVLKRQSGIILTLMAGGPESRLYKQIFAPELNSSAEYSFPKTRLNESVWKEIQDGVTSEESDTMSKYEELDTGQLITIMLEQQAPSISEEEKQKTIDLISSVPAEHQANIRKAIIYTISRRELDKGKEKEFIKTVSENSDDKLVGTVAKWLLQSELYKG
jgi:hypothetical protein